VQFGSIFYLFLLPDYDIICRSNPINMNITALQKLIIQRQAW